MFQVPEANEEQLKSRYNEAAAANYRRDKLWQEYQHYRSLGGIKNLMKANLKLDLIFGELSGDCNAQDLKNFGKYKRLVIKHQLKPILLDQVLGMKETWLRIMTNKQGKGTAYKDESEDDWD